MRWNFLLRVAAISLLALAGCREQNSAVENPESSADQTGTSALANSPPEQGAPAVAGQISDNDLALDQPPRQPDDAEPATDATAKDPTPILEEAHEIVERFDDESISRRWTVRLYVTFDRSKPWHQQAPGSWVEHGPYEEFYPDSEQRLMQGEFKEGKRHGQWTYWQADGQVAKQGEYKNARLNGLWQHFREDGTLLRTENYLNHQRHGTWKFYDSDGTTVIREQTFQHDEQVASNAPR